MSDKEVINNLDRVIDQAIKAKFPTVDEAIQEVERRAIVDLTEEGQSFSSQQDADLALNRKLRREYTPKLFLYMVLWTAFVGIITLLQGFKCWGFILADSALSILYGTTTVSVLGLMLAIIKGLFPISK